MELQTRDAYLARRADKRFLRVCLHVSALIECVALAACGTPVQTVANKAAKVVLEAVGIKAQKFPEAPPPSKIVKLHLEGAGDLNAGDDGHGLSTIVQIYKLRDQNGFLSLPYSSFGSEDKEQEAIGTDLLDVRELTLRPGQTLDLQEKMTAEAAYLGVVALFHSPSPRRWRFAFTTAQAEQITIGVHACAMTATSVSPIGMTLNESALLSPVKCK